MLSKTFTVYFCLPQHDYDSPLLSAIPSSCREAGEAGMRPQISLSLTLLAKTAERQTQLLKDVNKFHIEPDFSFEK